MEIHDVEGAVPWEDVLICSNEATQIRGVVARLKCLSIDRADIQHAIKEMARKMSAPCNRDLAIQKVNSN